MLAFLTKYWREKKVLRSKHTDYLTRQKQAWYTLILPPLPLWLGWYPRSKYLDGAYALHDCPTIIVTTAYFVLNGGFSSAVASTSVRFNQAPVSWPFNCLFRPSRSCAFDRRIVQSNLVYRTDLMLYAVSSVLQWHSNCPGWFACDAFETSGAALYFRRISQSSQVTDYFVLELYRNKAGIRSQPKRQIIRRGEDNLRSAWCLFWLLLSAAQKPQWISDTIIDAPH